MSWPGLRQGAFHTINKNHIYFSRRFAHQNHVFAATISCFKNVILVSKTSRKIDVIFQLAATLDIGLLAPSSTAPPSTSRGRLASRGLELWEVAMRRWVDELAWAEARCISVLILRRRYHRQRNYTVQIAAGAIVHSPAQDNPREGHPPAGWSCGRWP